MLGQVHNGIIIFDIMHEMVLFISMVLLLLPSIL